MKLTDEELIRRVKGMQRGNKDDFDRIYNAFFPYAYFVVQKTYLNKNDVEDIVQEAFVTIFSTARKLKKPASFKPWFDRVLCGAIDRAYRKNAKNSVHDDIFFSEIPEINEELLPEHSFESNEMRQQVLNAVDELPIRQRQVIIAYYFQGLKIADITEILQIREGSVKNALYNARMSLKKKLAPSTRAYTFTLPLAYILRSEFELFSASPDIAADIWNNILQSSKPASPLMRLASRLGATGSFSRMAATVLITAGVVTGGISAAVQYPYTLADMLGAEDAALLIEICETSSESLDDELNALLERKQIAPHTRGRIVGGADIAESFVLIKGGKRLYVIRVWDEDGYRVKYRFEPKGDPELRLDDIILFLERGL